MYISRKWYLVGHERKLFFLLACKLIGSFCAQYFCTLCTQLQHVVSLIFTWLRSITDYENISCYLLSNMVFQPMLWPASTHCNCLTLGIRNGALLLCLTSTTPSSRTGPKLLVCKPHRVQSLKNSPLVIYSWCINFSLICYGEPTPATYWIDTRLKEGCRYYIFKCYLAEAFLASSFLSS